MKYRALSLTEAIERKALAPDSEIFVSVLTPIGQMKVDELISLTDNGVFLTPYRAATATDMDLPFPAIEVEVAPAQQNETSQPEASANNTDAKADIEKAKPKKKLSLDVRKIKALRVAGWSMKKIGDELGCSESTIFNYLKKMEESNVIKDK